MFKTSCCHDLYHRSSWLLVIPWRLKGDYYGYIFHSYAVTKSRRFLAPRLNTQASAHSQRGDPRKVCLAGPASPLLIQPKVSVPWSKAPYSVSLSGSPQAPWGPGSSLCLIYLGHGEKKSKYQPQSFSTNRKQVSKSFAGLISATRVLP